LPENKSPAEERPKVCDLCGLRIGRSGVAQTIEEKTFHFCCHGCLYVFQILYNGPGGRPADYKQTDLYRACVAAGIIPGDQGALSLKDEGRPSEGLNEIDEPHLTQEVCFRVEGMWCTACSWLIEEVLRKTEGVSKAEVLFLSDLARIRYQPHLVSPGKLMNQISIVGYRAAPFEQETGSSEGRDLLLRLGVSAILTMNIMMISAALYFGFFEDLGEEAIAYLSFSLWAMATPVLFYSGLPILKRAYGGLRFFRPTMDTLIALGSLSAYGYSLFQLSRGSLHLYFDTAAMLITIVLLGTYVENHAREKVTHGITELYQLARQKVRLLREGVERWVVSDGVEAGEEFVVKKGERIPVDGRIISGVAHIDESFLTGESRPVKRSAGDDVAAGGVVLEGGLFLQARSRGSDSSINQIVNLLQEALSRKNRIELIADRITRWLVPGVLLLAAVTAACLLLWGHSSLDESMLRAVTVLVITCPCALGIATPLAKVASLGSGRARGILVRDPAVLERARDLDVIILDKTGTLTQGRFALQEILSVEGAGEDEILARAASVECHSDHLLAREVLAEASRRSVRWKKSASFECFEGQGVKGGDAPEIFIGNRAFMASSGMTVGRDTSRRARELEGRGMTVVFVAFERKVQALFAFGDSVKDSAATLVSELGSRGITPWLVSGDSEETTKAVAGSLGIANFRGQTLPADKAEIVLRLQQEGKRVGMVGDGINDTAALAQADVGFALGARSNILREASDITVLSDDPLKVLEAMDLSAATMRIIHQNLFFSLFYNILGVPLAVSGLLNPVIAVLAMFASSLTVVGNTLRISRNK
jgi:heavy metal translocating P-type ATPase